MLALVSLLAGCASLPFFGKDADADGQPRPSPQVPLYELEVRAPGALRKLLLDYLDLARFQTRAGERSDHAGRARAPRRRGAGAGALAARDRGLLRCRASR